MLIFLNTMNFFIYFVVYGSVTIKLVSNVIGFAHGTLIK